MAWYRQHCTFVSARRSEYASAGHMQPQMRLERIKISITMQEGKSPFDDECRDQAINRLPHRDPLMTQSPIVLGALEGNLGSAYWGIRAGAGVLWAAAIDIQILGPCW
jgi:hypothetical protein